MQTGSIRAAASHACLAVALGVAAACGAGPAADRDPLESETGSSLARSPNGESDWFVDRAVEVGLDFVHFNGLSGEFFYPEILPPGVGLFDYDNDGDLDAFIVQGRMLGEGNSVADALIPPSPSSPPTGRLYRNDLDGAIGPSSLKFVDVTETSGLTADRYGLGVATGDIDNDGWVDVFVTNYEADQLFRNEGDGTFTEIASRAAIEDRGDFGVSASFVDYDRDGWLDLYVGNNVDYTLDHDTVCTASGGVRDYCSPQTYGGRLDRLYRNQGNGTFEDVTETALQHEVEAGISRATGGQFGPALGVVAADYDGDGWVDIYVANDGSENLLWMNQQDGTFRDAALLSGAAVSPLGTPEASMGVAAGDYDNDGDDDLFMTHLMTEGNNLYVNDGSALFQERSAPTGLGPGSLSYTGWGTTWVDFDNDSWLDILAVNGAVRRDALVEVVSPEGDAPRVVAEGGVREIFPYHQRKTLFRNLGNGRFEEVSAQAGAVFSLAEVGRGAAFGDVDNDGDVDVLVGNNAGPVRLLVNTIGNRHHWLGLRLVGKVGNGEAAPTRDMLGARVAVLRDGEPTLWRRVHTDGSYASANDARVLVGLGESVESPQVRVIWPDGQIEVWSDVPVDRYTTLTKGEGTAR